MEYLDFEKPIEELMTQLNKAKELGGEGVDVKQAISDLETKLKGTRKSIYSNLSPWQKVQLSRHPQRPYTLDYIENIEITNMIGQIIVQENQLNTKTKNIDISMEQKGVYFVKVFLANKSIKTNSLILN